MKEMNMGKHISKQLLMLSLAGALCLFASGCKEEGMALPEESNANAPMQHSAALREAQAAAKAAQEGKIYLFGVTLGKPFPEDMPQCPEEYFLYMRSPTKEACVYLPDRPNGDPETPYVGVLAFPPSHIYSSNFGADRVALGADANKAPNVIYISIYNGSKTQDEFMHILRAQMGEPTYFAVKSAEQTKPPEGIPSVIWRPAREGSVMAVWKGQEAWAMYSSSRYSGDGGMLQVGFYSALKNGELPKDKWPF